jgi:hypothetical protein
VGVERREEGRSRGNVGGSVSERKGGRGTGLCRGWEEYMQIGHRDWREADGMFGEWPSGVLRMASLGEESAHEMAVVRDSMSGYYRYMFPTRAEFEVRLLMIELVSRAIRREFPQATVRPFGSWQTQLYLPQGCV